MLVHLSVCLPGTFRNERKTFAPDARPPPRPLSGLAPIFVFGIPANTVFIVGLALFCPLSPLLTMTFTPHEHGARQHELPDIAASSDSPKP